MVGRFKLRFFFDGGSGTCLWSGNDLAQQTWGYAVNHQKLPLNERTIIRLNEIIRWYDEGFDWDNPADPCKWERGECEKFTSTACELLATVREELGADFDIVDEFRHP
jgi:hypothetical protein